MRGRALAPRRCGRRGNETERRDQQIFAEELGLAQGLASRGVTFPFTLPG